MESLPQTQGKDEEISTGEARAKASPENAMDFDILPSEFPFLNSIVGFIDGRPGHQRKYTVSEAKSVKLRNENVLIILELKPVKR